MASGLSMPVGFKNGTDGAVQTAVDAMSAARIPHSFLGIDRQGRTSIVKTAGNPDCHLVMRGGRNGPNYLPSFIEDAAAAISKNGIRPRIMVDCSHANSGKKPENQPVVWNEILRQRRESHQAGPVFGAMLESFIHHGNQPIPANHGDLQYGLSVTDACLSWEETEQLLLNS
jgi:3-deoxy-7-phosphoheptulonate synthase